jgi:hypothetical protein
MGPTRKAWMFYEHFIRKAAGLGMASTQADPDRYDWQHGFTDVLVIGAGPAGLTAALGAAQAGLDVVLVEQDFELGGSLLGQAVDSAQARWRDQMLADLRQQRPGAHPDPFDRHGPVRRQYRRRGRTHGARPGGCRARHATPATAHPARGAHRHGLRCARTPAGVRRQRPAGRDAVQCGWHLCQPVSPSYPVAAPCFCHNNDAAYRATRSRWPKRAPQVCVADLRSAVPGVMLRQAHAAGIDVRAATAVSAAQGGQRVKRCLLAPYDMAQGRITGAAQAMDVDLVAMSGGWTPTVHLTSHRGIKPVYREDLACFVPGGFDKAHVGAGSMVGCQQLLAAVRSGWDAALQAVPQTTAVHWLGAVSRDARRRKRRRRWRLLPSGRSCRPGRRARPSWISRTTWPSTISTWRTARATTRWSTSSATPRWAWAPTRARPPTSMRWRSWRRGAAGLEAEVGTTTFRPPYTPVTIGALAGRSVRAHLAARAAHRHARLAREANGGDMMEAGAWKRPLWYHGHGANLSGGLQGRDGIVREQVGIADVSTLGKIDVQGRTRPSS